jgi:hypothetical protein
MIKLLQPGDDSRRNWRTINDLTSTIEGGMLPNQSERAKLAGLVGAGRDPETPFLIYRGSTWLKFKVATGFVITTGDPFIPADVDTEITITDGVARYWFYLDITSTTASVESSATTPTWDINKVPLGWVDTATYATAQRSVIYQFNGIFIPCV